MLIFLSLCIYFLLVVFLFVCFLTACFWRNKQIKMHIKACPLLVYDWCTGYAIDVNIVTGKATRDNSQPFLGNAIATRSESHPVYTNSSRHDFGFRCCRVFLHIL